ncbi:MAG TPA: DUF6443 domain-containing protein [Cyclobacteriaceae bacterium]
MQRFIFITLLFLSVYTVNAQITGPTSVTLGQSASYLVYEDIIYSPFNFTVVGGTVTASSRSGTNYNVTITWNFVGTGSVKFNQDGQTLAVTVTGTCAYMSPVAPAATFSVSTPVCGSSTTISYTGTPPTGYTWFWQTTSTGTATTNSTTSYTATTSGTYYLRARSTCIDNWGPAIATPAVTINPIPSTPTATTNISACMLSTFTLAGTAGANGNTLKWYYAATGGTSIAQGTSVSYSDTSGDFPTNTTFYASSFNTTSGCESTSRKALAVTFKAMPPAPTSVTGSSICASGTGSVTLTGVAGNSNTLRWYGAYWYTTPGTPLLGSGASFTTPSLSTTTTYYARAYNATTTCESAPQPVIATVQLIPNASATNQSIFSGQTTSIAIANPNNVSGTVFNWTVAQTGLSGGVSGSGATIAQALTTTAQASGTATYTVTPVANSCAGTPIAVTATVYPTPTPITAPQNYIAKNAPVTLDAGAGYTTYAWKNSANVSVGNTQTITTKIPDTYSVTLTKSGATASPISFVLGAQFTGQNVNYVITNTPLVDNLTNPAILNNISVDSVSQNIMYYDGLGRPAQNVVTQGSPLRKDIVTTMAYDAYGREYRKYLPVAAGGDGRYKSNIIDANGNYAAPALNFYNNGTGDYIPDDTRPFSETVFELSPLNRPSKDYGVGDGWNNTNITPTPSVIIDKPLVHAYDVNNSSAEQIIAWVIDPVSGLPIYAPSKGTMISNGYYMSGQLSITSTKDEQGHEVREYTDKAGHIILKKVQLIENAQLNDTTGTHWTQTYYIYDDMGRLALVLSPEAVNAIK